MYMSLEKFPKKLPFILEIFQKEVQSKMSIDDFEKIRKKVLISDFNHHFIPEYLV